MNKPKTSAGLGLEGGSGTASSAEGQSSATQRSLQGVQLARLNVRLQELGKMRDLLRARGDDPDEYAKWLGKQRADLVQKERLPLLLRPPSLPTRLTVTLNKLSDIFDWWESVIVPPATILLNQAPNSADTGGTGIGADIYQGDLALGGEISNSSTQEQWWINTWQYIVPFPPTPSNYPSSASLSYRFNVGASLAFYRQDVISGSVHVYATVAASGDLNTQPIDFNQPVSSDFAIDATLPVASVPPIVSGGAQISGTIPVVPGGTPAIGIIMGLIISVVDGYVQIIPGEYSSIELAPPGATSATDIGKIQFRRDQPFWVEAVAKMLAS